MGCDIHDWVEVRKDGVWKKVGAIFKNPYFKEDGKGYGEEFIDHPFDLRSYDTFAILANVRNGSGFAGVSTGLGFNPIAMPKGIPEDASDEYKELANEYGADGHSHSYLTLAEIKYFDWYQVTKKSGTVGPTQYLRWKEKGSPESWCGWSSGEYISNEVMDAKISSGELTPKEDPSGWEASKFNTVVEWEVTYMNTAQTFYENTIPALEKLAADEGVTFDDVRMVFFFDN